MIRYQNVAFDRNSSSFAAVNQTKSEATFKGRQVAASVSGERIPMVQFSVSLRKEAQAAVCGKDCTVPIVESASITFNVEQGAERLVELRGELNRLFDEAEEKYALAEGFVPPAYAAFLEE